MRAGCLNSFCVEGEQSSRHASVSEKMKNRSECLSSGVCSASGLLSQNAMLPYFGVVCLEQSQTHCDR